MKTYLYFSFYMSMASGGMLDLTAAFEAPDDANATEQALKLHREEMRKPAEGFPPYPDFFHLVCVEAGAWRTIKVDWPTT